MGEWPEITEPLLRERQAMSDARFLEFLAGLLEAVGRRKPDEAHYESAIGYPWERAPGSCLVTGGETVPLADLDAARRDDLLAEYRDPAAGRIALLAYGANGSPQRLALKLAHLPAGHRQALVLAGELEGFDVGAAAQPPLFSTMPATLVPSPGTAVDVALLLLTPVQFTALWWTELSYKVGALEGITLRTELTPRPLERVIAFSSRYGAFCVDGEPVAMAAIAARGRRAPEMTQVEILDAAARMSIGEGSGARDLITLAFEDPAAFMAERYPSFRAASRPFRSEHWTEMPSGRAR